VIFCFVQDLLSNTTCTATAWLASLRLRLDNDVTALMRRHEDATVKLEQLATEDDEMLLGNLQSCLAGLKADARKKNSTEILCRWMPELERLSPRVKSSADVRQAFALAEEESRRHTR
jgi:hypothetical protein